MDKSVYTLRRVSLKKSADWWRAETFATAEEGRIACFQEQSDPVRPRTIFRGAHDGAAIMLRYEVGGVGAFAAPREYNGWVYRDSCCEFFVQPPRPFGGYMNFEVSAAGVLHTSHILDETRAPDGFKNFRYVRPEHGAQVEIMRWRGDEPATPPCGGVVQNATTTWGVAMRIPFALLRTYIEPWREGEPWRANFYSCRLEGGVKYFASWAPIPVFNFHTPQFFGELRFE